MITPRLYVLAFLALISTTGCTREVIVRETPAANNIPNAISPSTPSPSKPSVTISPINEKEKLCPRAYGRSFEIYNPSNTYLDATQKYGYASPEVNAAGEKFRDEVVKVLPYIRGLVGPDAPKDVAEAINGYADAADKFSEAAAAHSSAEELNPLSHNFGHSIDRFKEVCGIGQS